MDKIKQLQQGLSFEESDSEESDTETKDVDEKSHARLLDAISTMDGSKRLTHTLRNVHGQTMSETGLASSVSADSLMTDLINSLGESASFSKMKRQLESAYKSGKGAVETPAPKHVKEKAQRTVGYEKTVTDISRWEPVVMANRKAPQLRFPLQRVSERMLDQQTKYTPVTDLEKEMEELNKKARPENQIPKGKVFTPKEEQEMAAMSLEEAKQRRAQLLTMRSLIYNKNSRLRWQNKIKSKRYRRAKKKEKEKVAEKELEALAVSDPQALHEKMEESDKKRILERGRLRHAGGKKFAREAKIFAKYDDEKRQHLQDMLEKHRELKRKRQEDTVLSSDSEEEEEEGGKDQCQQPTVWPTPSPSSFSQPTPSFQPTLSSPSQPTLSLSSSSSSSQPPLSLSSSSQPPAPETERPAPPPEEEDEKPAEEEGEEKDDVVIPPKNTHDSRKEKRKKKKSKKKRQAEKTDPRPKLPASDTPPAQKPVPQGKVSDVLVTIDDAFDDDDDDDDGVVAQFVADKEEVVEEEREKDVDTFLPGWGRWAGPDIVEPAALRKKFVIKATPTPRKDNHIGHVVFTTKQNKAIQKHQLKKVPHPYRSVEHMKKVLSATLTPDRVKPKVVIAKSGKIIQPLEESVLLQDPKRKAADIDLSHSKPRSKKRKRLGV